MFTHGVNVPPVLAIAVVDMYATSRVGAAGVGTNAVRPRNVNGHRFLPGSRRESHPPAPTDPHVSLSTHTARAVWLDGAAPQYRQWANSSGFRVRTPCSHARVLLGLRASRLYFHRAQRSRW
jgi:hypothetical protein